jgi:hypothetical protein
MQFLYFNALISLEELISDTYIFTIIYDKWFVGHDTVFLIYFIDAYTESWGQCNQYLMEDFGCNKRIIIRFKLRVAKILITLINDKQMKAHTDRVWVGGWQYSIHHPYKQEDLFRTILLHHKCCNKTVIWGRSIIGAVKVVGSIMNI